MQNEVNENQGINNGVNPARDAAHGLVVAFFPPGEGYVAGDVDVKEQKPQQSQPPVAHPCHPGKEDERN